MGCCMGCGANKCTAAIHACCNWVPGQHCCSSQPRTPSWLRIWLQRCCIAVPGPISRAVGCPAAAAGRWGLLGRARSRLRAAAVCWRDSPLEAMEFCNCNWRRRDRAQRQYRDRSSSPAAAGRAEIEVSALLRSPPVRCDTHGCCDQLIVVLGGLAHHGTAASSGCCPSAQAGSGLLHGESHCGGLAAIRVDGVPV